MEHKMIPEMNSTIVQSLNKVAVQQAIRYWAVV